MEDLCLGTLGNVFFGFGEYTVKKSYLSDQDTRFYPLETIELREGDSSTDLLDKLFSGKSVEVSYGWGFNSLDKEGNVRLMRTPQTFSSPNSRMWDSIWFLDMLYASVFTAEFTDLEEERVIPFDMSCQSFSRLGVPLDHLRKGSIEDAVEDEFRRWEHVIAILDEFEVPEYTRKDMNCLIRNRVAKNIAVIAQGDVFFHYGSTIKGFDLQDRLDLSQRLSKRYFQWAAENVPHIRNGYRHEKVGNLNVLVTEDGEEVYNELRKVFATLRDCTELDKVLELPGLELEKISESGMNNIYRITGLSEKPLILKLIKTELREEAIQGAHNMTYDTPFQQFCAHQDTNYYDHFGPYLTAPMPLLATEGMCILEEVPEHIITSASPATNPDYKTQQTAYSDLITDLISNGLMDQVDQQWPGNWGIVSKDLEKPIGERYVFCAIDLATRKTAHFSIPFDL